MVTQTPPTKKRKRQSTNGFNTQTDGSAPYETTQNWPLDFRAAYQRDKGIYTIYNATTLLAEEPLELINGWLVWQAMTNVEERGIAGNIQEILSLAARMRGFGQAYPDQFECVMVNEDLYKPDVTLLSTKRYDSQVEPVKTESDHFILRGSPELVIEIRSPSNRRTKERKKRKIYFDSGALVIWDVDCNRRQIWVYEVENSEKGQEYTEEDEISCEALLPGWKRKVGDFFRKGLSAEEIVGEAASQWRAESEAKGRAEGELEALKRVLIRQASRRFGTEGLPADFETRLGHYDVEQLNELADNLAVSRRLEDWLSSFPTQI